MTLGLISYIKALNLIALILVNIFERKKCFLAHEGDLFICPDFGAVVTLLLNFILKLLNSVLKIVCIILPLLCAREEKFSFLIEFGLHLLLNDYLLF